MPPIRRSALGLSSLPLPLPPTPLMLLLLLPFLLREAACIEWL
jgi:hypothetical protein